MLTETQRQIEVVCDSIKKLLLEKNEDYGDSAITPLQIFSKGGSVEQLNVRIDDKLSRIKNTEVKNIIENTEMDLIGYLILKRVKESLLTKTVDHSADKLDFRVSDLAKVDPVLDRPGKINQVSPTHQQYR